MDLASLVANKPLLASLTREYELLKAATADINYEEWIFKRLKLAAAQQSSSPWGAAGAVASTTTAEPASSQTTVAAPVQQQANPQAAPSGGLSVKLQALARRNRVGQRATDDVPYDRDGALSLAGQHAADAPPVVTAVLQDWTARDTTNTQHAPAQSQGGNGNRAPAPLWGQPETSVDTAKRSMQIPASKNTPNWVAAAKLQISLQSSSAVVPLMHAAAERERRLAATAALVRQKLAVSSAATSVDTNAIAQQHALLAQHYVAGTAATKQEQQNQQQLLQQVVHQNQQLLQVVQQQQTLLQRHEGLLTGAGKEGDAATGSSAAAVAAHRAAPGVASAPPASEPPQLPDAVKNSWLVRSVLQPPAGGVSDSNTSAGEAGRPNGMQQEQAAEPAPTDRRSQLKAALRHLLTAKDVSGLPQQQSITSLLQALLGQQQQGAVEGSNQQLLAGFQAAVQALASKQQQRRSIVRHSQDENASPIFGALRTVQPSQQQQPRRSSRISSAAGAMRDSRRHEQLQQQHSRRQKPGWSSEVFVPPPSHMLRRRMSGVADAWGLPAAVKPKVRPASAASTGKPARPRSAAGATANGSSSRRTTAAGAPAKPQQHEQQCNPGGGQRYSMPGTLQHAQWGSAVYDSAAVGAEADETGICDPWPVAQSVAAVAATAGGLGAMSADQVQQVEMQVKQQLQQEQQQEEEGRLARLEETTTNILGVLGRLEQQMQKNPAAAVAGGAGSGAAPSNTAATVAAAAAGAAGVLQDPLTMSSMLSALDRIAAQEVEIRRRWFGSSDISPAPAIAGVGSILEVKGGVLIVNPGNATAAAAAARDATGRQQATRASAAPQRLQQQPPIQPASQQQQQQQGEVLSKQALKSIKTGRSRYLQHQALVDGSLEVLDSPGGAQALSPAAGSDSTGHKRAKPQLQPTYVVEAVADLLLDELLHQQVDELDGFCDALCNQLFEAEFEEA